MSRMTRSLQKPWAGAAKEPYLQRQARRRPVSVKKRCLAKNSPELRAELAKRPSRPMDIVFAVGIVYLVKISRYRLKR